MDNMNSNPYLSMNERLTIGSMGFKLAELHSIPYEKINNVISDIDKIDKCIYEIEKILNVFTDLRNRSIYINKNC